MFDEYTFLPIDLIITVITELYSTFNEISIVNTTKIANSLKKEEYISILPDIVLSIIKEEYNLEFAIKSSAFSKRQLLLLVYGVFCYCTTRKLKVQKSARINGHWLDFWNIITCAIEHEINNIDEVETLISNKKPQDICVPILLQLFGVKQFEFCNFQTNLNNCVQRIRQNLNVILGEDSLNPKFRKASFDFSFTKAIQNSENEPKKYLNEISQKSIKKGNRRLSSLKKGICNSKKYVRFSLCDSNAMGKRVSEPFCNNQNDSMENDIAEFCNAFSPMTNQQQTKSHLINENPQKISVCKLKIYELADFTKNGKLRKKSLEKSWSDENLSEIQACPNKKALRASQSRRSQTPLRVLNNFL